MTINITPSPLPKPPITVHKHIQDGVEGYLFRTFPEPFFLPEAEADKLARYMLFSPRTEEAVELDSDDAAVPPPGE